MRWILLMLVAMLLAGCPPADPDVSDPRDPVVEDEFTRFGKLVGRQDDFYSELRRLQKLNTANPGLGGIMPGRMNTNFSLASRLESARAGIVLLDETSGEEWVLWFWSDDQDVPPTVDVIKDKESAGGYQMELNIGSGSMSINVTARWVQGRYLQINRELMLGGLDHTTLAPEGYTAWTLDGPWLPYRMIPANSGPFGVVASNTADGEWYGRGYPSEARVPAVAAYDSWHGMLLCVVDEHPRKLDRDYTSEYRISTDYGYGALVRINNRHFDPQQDEFTRPTLASSLPMRDSIVIEPLAIFAESIESGSVEIETSQVISYLADAVHGFHLHPEPPEPTKPGSLLVLQDWVQAVEEAEEFTSDVSHAWNTVGAIVTKEAAVRPPAVIPPDKMGAQNRQPNNQENDPGLDQVSESGPDSIAGAARMYEIDTFLPVKVAIADPRDPNQPAELDLHGRETGDRPGSDTNGGHVQPDIRDPQTAAKLSRDACGTPEGLEDISGCLIEEADAGDTYAQISPQAQTLVCAVATEAVIQQFTASQLVAASPNRKLASDIPPYLAFPAFANAQLAHPLIRATGEDLEPGTIVLANRLATYLDILVFGVNPYIANPEGTLAEQVLATVGGVRGHLIDKSLQQYYGFEAFAENQRELRGAGGELLVIHSKPVGRGYLSGGERPAEATEIVAILPGDWDGATTVWIAFYGVGGSVAVDEYNNMSVTWGDWGHWREKLPVGYWIVKHPDPDNVIAGDAVLVIRKPIAPLGMPGAELG